MGCAASGAGAYATIAPPPIPSATSGLPDGRVYEQVSPSNKHGYQAGASGRTEETPQEVFVYFSVASPDGNAVSFGSKGPAANVNASGLSQNFVAERIGHGWTSRSTTGRGLGQNERLSLLFETPKWLEYSPDLSHLAYIVNQAQVDGAPAIGSRNVYLMGSNPLEEPTWLLRAADEPSREDQSTDELVGMSPDASIVYIAYEAKLLPQDASRSGWGLYEYREGRLSEAGVLPDGSVPPGGSMPAATAATVEASRLGENNPASLDNQLSEDGKRVFFVAGGQLYVHKIEPDGSEHSVLVSASELPGHVGEAAQHGVELFENLAKNAGHSRSRKNSPTYAYASPDGSRVFFQSEDQLTISAPSTTEPKVYDFDVDTGTLEYLPGVVLGGIVTAAKDGSSFAFVNAASAPDELDLWSAGPGGGEVKQIAQLPGAGPVGPARMVADDSVLVFQARAPIPGFNNANSEQVYRYDAKSNELACVSCPPLGIAPSGDAYLSAMDQYFSKTGSSVMENQVVNDDRGVSSDGKRIFFGSPDPLVGRDTNGYLDTYEWENGEIFLISSGTGTDYSPFLDNSESGGDVFFTTSDELVAGDNDAGFDVYDARIPRPGDNSPPSAVPCSGDVCQGPPSVVQLLGAPASSVFSGVGNVTSASPAVKGKSLPKAASRARKLASSLDACRKGHNKRRRLQCERQARKRYRTAKPAVKVKSGGAK
ncbi:MAG: hypothetical protein WB998_03375 [Solirubrobacteraceae bacterium]